MIITSKNYFEEIQPYLAQMPKEIKEAHELAKSVLNEGYDPFNSGDEDIDSMSKLLLEKVNAIILAKETSKTENAPAAKKDAAPKKKPVAKAPEVKKVPGSVSKNGKSGQKTAKNVKKPVKKVAKKTVTKAKAPKQVPGKKIAAAVPVPVIKKTVFSKELSLIKSFINLNNKAVAVTSIKAKRTTLAKAIEQKKVTQHLPELKQILAKYEGVLDKVNTDTTHLNWAIEPAFYTKLKDLVKNALLKLQVNYLAGVSEENIPSSTDLGKLVAIENNSTLSGTGIDTGTSSSNFQSQTCKAPSVLPIRDDDGFIPANQKPKKPQNTFIFRGEMGKLLGPQQRYRLQFLISGETHSSKSQLAMQVANELLAAFPEEELAWIDWEQGGLESKDTQAMIDRNIDIENLPRLKVSGEVERNLEAVENLTKKYKMIALDSGSVMEGQIHNKWLEKLRKNHPDTIFIIIMQLNEKGNTAGGSTAQFNAPVVLKTYRPNENDYTKNYGKVFKNRGNPTGNKYNMFTKKVINEEEI